MVGKTENMNKKKLLFVIGVDWSFVSHRLPIALAAIKQGYEVHIATMITDKYDLLVENGLIVHPLPLNRGSTNIIAEIKTFFSILKIFNNLRPDIVHLVTIKPVLYGGIAVRLSGIKAVVAAVPGLGFVFLAKGIKASIRRFLVALLYRLALSARNIKVIFQNPDDKKRILSITRLDEDKTIMIRGSGADLSKYDYRPLPDKIPVVVMAARLLRDKGVCEFVEAATMLKDKGINARFCLVGEPDKENPSSVTESDLSLWKEEGKVEIWGYRTDIAQIFSESYMVVLPSYSEGLPKVLIEAAACGRAVVTTDVSGCRDAIEKDVTGFLVPARSSTELAEAINKLLQNRGLCEKMGKAGRKLAEKSFDIKSVVATHLDIYKNIQKVD